MKKILITSLLSFMSIISFAQEEEIRYKNLPEKGDFMVSLLLGNNQYANTVLAPTSNTVSDVSAPSNNANTFTNSLVNMAGVEARYFIKDNFALKFSGGVIFTNTPGRENIISTDTSVIPAVNAVEAQETLSLNFVLGGEHHFETKSNRLSPFIGLGVPFYYTKSSYFDPGASAAAIDDPYGASHEVLFGIGAQAYLGVDYHFNKDIYFGVQINGIGYDYTYVQESVGAGFDIAEGDTTGINFLTQPVLKIGFKF